MLPNGLTILPDAVSVEDQNTLTASCFSRRWDDTLRRKTQQYGYRYDYGGPTTLQRCEPIPDCMLDIYIKSAQRHGFPQVVPDQVIVNHYEPGQGIGAHTDDVNKFGDTVVIFSLLSPTTMHFAKTDHTTVDIRLLPGSLTVMRGEARYGWTHEIKPRKTDIVDGQRVQRGTRLSVTFRWLK